MQNYDKNIVMIPLSIADLKLQRILFIVDSV
jgi:hypothetical protein